MTKQYLINIITTVVHQTIPEIRWKNCRNCERRLPVDAVGYCVCKGFIGHSRKKSRPIQLSDLLITIAKKAATGGGFKGFLKGMKEGFFYYGDIFVGVTGGFWYLHKDGKIEPLNAKYDLTKPLSE